MNVRVSARARRRIEAIASWWHANRPAAPTLFEDELRAVVERLQVQPTLGLVYERISGKVVRRVLLRESGQHLYYVLDEEAGALVLHTVWGARRGKLPKF